MEFGLAVVVFVLWALTVALQTTRVGALCGGHGALSTISGLLSAGVAVRWVVAGSLPKV